MSKCNRQMLSDTLDFCNFGSPSHQITLVQVQCLSQPSTGSADVTNIPVHVIYILLYPFTHIFTQNQEVPVSHLPLKTVRIHMLIQCSR